LIETEHYFDQGQVLSEFTHGVKSAVNTFKTEVLDRNWLMIIPAGNAEPMLEQIE
jgi:hypothetical protein